MSVVTRITTSEELTVPFSPEEVWDVLATASAYQDWWPVQWPARLVSDQPGLLGSEIEVRPLFGGLFRFRFEELHEPFAMRLRFFGGRFEGPGGFLLRPGEEGHTRVRYDVDVFVRAVGTAAMSQILPLDTFQRFHMRRVLRNLARRLRTQHKLAGARRRAEAEAAARLAAEEAARVAAENGARLAAEEAAARLEEQEALSRRLAAEARAAEEVRAAAETAARLAAEEEARRLAAELEARRIAEAEAARLAAEEAERRRAAEQARLAAEAEAERLREEARLLAVAEARRAEEARQREEAEAARLAAEIAARLAAEEETRRLAAELEARRVAEAEAARLAAEEAERRRAAEEARLAAEAEAARIAAESAARLAAEAETRHRLALEAAAKRAEQEAEDRRLAEEARQREEAEAARLAAEIAARLAAEEETRRLAAELEARRVAEAEAARLAAEEAERRRAAEEARREAEEEAARLAAEIAARLAAEEEARRLAEEREARIPSPPRPRVGWLRRMLEWLETPETRTPETSAAPGSETNFSIARNYLAALSSRPSPRDLDMFLAKDRARVEYPHRFLARATSSGVEGIFGPRARVAGTFEAETYELRGATGGGSQVAMEVAWSGRVGRDATPLARGQELDARLAVFLKFQDGRIVREHVYACFEPWTNPLERARVRAERAAAEREMPRPGRSRPGSSPSNFDVARSYLAALSAGAGPEEVAGFFAEEGIQEEFPNTFAPAGVVRMRDEIGPAREKDLALFKSEYYELRGAFGGGSQVALEISWTAVIGAAAGPYAAGQKLEGQVAMFLKFRDGLIVRQRTYRCIPGESDAAGVLTSPSFAIPAR